MQRSFIFWSAVLVFQIVYGAVVFMVTRQIYQDQSGVAGQKLNPSQSVSQGLPHPLPQGMPNQTTVLLPGSERVTLEDARRLVKKKLDSPGAATGNSPEQLSREADRHFQEGLFEQAAAEYARVLEQAPYNVDVYNNLGLTLHYVGRSQEAVEILEKGLAVDDTHQRIWLTLGFVQSGLGDVTAARRSLNTAAQLGPDSTIGMEAKRLLDSLP